MGVGWKNVECKGILKETNDDNTICSFVVLFVLNGGTVYIYLSHCDDDDDGDGDDGVFDRE